jgi:hypothetical protein
LLQPTVPLAHSDSATSIRQQLASLLSEKSPKLLSSFGHYSHCQVTFSRQNKYQRNSSRFMIKRPSAPQVHRPLLLAKSTPQQSKDQQHEHGG